MLDAGDKWIHLAQAFRNLGDYLADGCENLDAADPEFDELYTVHVALLESIKAQNRVIMDRFDAIDQEGESSVTD